MLDLKIINGEIIDGSGSARYRGDIGISGQDIVAVGKVDEPARQTIDAAGRVVAPGFVDVHTHYDAQAFWDPYLSPSCYHGVTTVIGGFCGFSIAPLTPDSAGYLLPMLARVEGIPVATLQQGVPWNWSSFGSYLEKLDGKLGVNAGFFAGHSAIRRAVMGTRAVGEQATPDDLRKMTALLDRSLAEGALGFSTTVSSTHNDADGNPVPSRFASREELLALAAVCSRHEGTGLELLPDTEFDPDMVELISDFSLAGQRPVNWNVLVLTGSTPDLVLRMKHQLSVSDHARAKGARVVALTLPTGSTIFLNMKSGFLFDTLPGWDALFRLPVAERIACLKDPVRRKALQDGADSGATVLSKMVSNWTGMTLAQTFHPDSKPFEGRTIGDIAAESGRAPFDVFADIAVADELRTLFRLPARGEDPETYRLRAELWNDDRTLVGASDAGAHMDMLDAFAFSTKLLQNGVRKYGVISLERAVRQLTSVPAAFMGLRHRGLLKTGWRADIVVFDPNQVGCGTSYIRNDLPGNEGRLYAEATGISHVVVNGQTIVRDGVHTGATPGTVFRSGRDTRTVGLGG